ncbi:MAG TPA: aminopeptidase P family protein [bacterium]|nr:aminopeptidase P family protein [bacterium]
MQRLEKLRERMAKKKIPALLLTNPINIGYLSGFAGSEDIALITSKKAMLFTPLEVGRLGRPPRSRRGLLTGFTDFLQIKKRKDPFFKTLIPILDKLKIKRLGFEAEHLSYSRYRLFSKNLKGFRLIPTKGLVENLRRVKNQKEIEAIRRGIEIAESALTRILKKIKVSIKEREVAALLEYEIKKGGAEGSAFPPIVAFGRRTSYPHSKPSITKLRKGDLIKIDWGAIYRRYSSDLTRSFVLGRATEKQRKIYFILYRAQSEAIEKIKPGIECVRIDKIARDIITKEGYGKFFSHGLGHGIGREVHEGPYLKSEDHTLIEPGMVLTVEPGIYLPGWGGIRIEDMVLVTAKGCEVLSRRAPEELPEL